MANIKYFHHGVRLHVKQFFYDLNKKHNYEGKYFLGFESLVDGLKAEKILKNHNFKFKSVPVPDCIDNRCGVSIICENYKDIQNFLIDKNIKCMVYKYEDNQLKEIL